MLKHANSVYFAQELSHNFLFIPLTRNQLWPMKKNMVNRFEGSFTQQEAISEEAIEAAVRVLRSGRLHRYNLVEGEAGEVALLEQEFAAFVGARYCLAVASGGYALATALRALGVGCGDKVLTNSFTLAPVPGSIAAVGAIPVYVDVTEDLVIDLRDLTSKATEANVLLLSHMRGHICDMDALMEICKVHQIVVIEDCAHTMGAKWNDTWSGRFGEFGCYSTQTYKHINSGEGGFLVTDDAEAMAKAIMLSGSYMLYERHSAGPPKHVFEDVKYLMPNISGRMDHLRAAILRPQLKTLEAQSRAWNSRYREIANGLNGTPGLHLINRPKKEYFVGSSIQFLLKEWSSEALTELIKRCSERGVELKWFGAKQPIGFTSTYTSWKYAEHDPMPKSDKILAGLMDMRIPLTFSLEDCAKIASIIRSEVSGIWKAF